MLTCLKQKEIRVFTNGCFDILHRGHYDFLKKARSLGHILIVGINSDASIRNLKGKDRPINTEKDRKYYLEQLHYVDIVRIFNSEEELLRLIQEIKPDVFVKGSDYEQICSITGINWVKSNNCRFEYIKYNPEYSTTKIIEKIRGSLA